MDHLPAIIGIILGVLLTAVVTVFFWALASQIIRRLFPPSTGSSGHSGPPDNDDAQAQPGTPQGRE